MLQIDGKRVRYEVYLWLFKSLILLLFTSTICVVVEVVGDAVVVVVVVVCALSVTRMGFLGGLGAVEVGTALLALGWTALPPLLTLP